ncbi:Inosine/uridine-preferring nucleoside hydrolase domain-containing protein [Protomyces lactucae-debilis]|uniref:Inosine/uridine-preferring nucleoside hydrolase domain-containing protein n=1 Tax=Protomyces lactucae-debilis TaxID=2754530 RepID=A0A1Y2F3S5_PROLT|nr:Inosine/uridine-preferring nucleoside hydrolase domain-containing protein [Protomyces lactucae-debilis]ORY78531.1 Inosine/uridine-preferring nucleoside hydrolase domain-containing protein [Protomyces lactucae-debilis]
MPQKIIIDTDPGVDDVLALLMALASPELDLLAITTVHGNIDLYNTTRNALSLFNVLQADGSQSWMKRDKPVLLAAGALHPLVAEKAVDAAYFHGRDGLGNVSAAFPEHVPGDSFTKEFSTVPTASADDKPLQAAQGLQLSSRPAHEEILRILAEEPEDTVTIVALGPLTNLSLAATQDYKTLARCKEFVIMGGALAVPGNVTPKAEFNCLGDPEAWAHILSLSSKRPQSTWHSSPESLHKRLELTLLPLDTTTFILLSYGDWHNATSLPNVKETLLARWCSVFIERTFETMKHLFTEASVEKLRLSMHDPACIWYLLRDRDDARWKIKKELDVRMECEGRWTRGMCIVDERGRQRLAEGLEEDESDHDGWLSSSRGNRVAWVKETPGSEAFTRDLLSRVFGA